MYLTKESEHAYRFGDHGPKYLTQGPNVDLGVVVITPGEHHPCHLHETHEESFLALEGECQVWVNGELTVMKTGDYMICAPCEAHYFENVSDSNFKAVFVKAPHPKEKDSIYIDWKPGQVYDPNKRVVK